MARIRTIKPDFFKDETVADLPPETRLFFIGLWLLADREGRLENRPRYFHAELFPYEKTGFFPDEHVAALLDASLVKAYRAGGKEYLVIPNFLKHQRPNHREPASELPAPARTGKPRHARARSRGREGKGREGKGREGKENTSTDVDDFSCFWEKYPRKVGKKAAKKAWATALKENPQRDLLAISMKALEHQTKTEQWKKDNGQFIPHPATWLNQGRWDDQPTQTHSQRPVSKPPTPEEIEWNRRYDEQNKQTNERITQWPNVK